MKKILLVMKMNPWTEMMSRKSLRMKRAWVMHLMEAKPNLKATALVNSPPNVRSNVSIL